MSLPLRLRPEAEADLRGARDWYNAQRSGLGDEFVGAIDDLLGRVARNPQLHAAVANNVRRVKTSRFPYVIYYRNLTDFIEVIAVLHGSRHPSTWQRRL